jgi:PTH1 family peptidyl-tRNA hydrolase
MPDADAPWIVIGLGNPGDEYAPTRHNVGVMVVEALASDAGGRLKSQRKTRCDVYETRWAGHHVVLARPHSYMNESGGPAKSLAGFFGVPVEHIIVVHDELDLPFGSLRVKAGGGDNGHNGLKSIRRAFDSGETARLRVGVGRPPGRQDPADYVLRSFSAAEKKQLPDILARAGAAAECLVTQGVESAQNLFNARLDSGSESPEG